MVKPYESKGLVSLLQGTDRRSIGRAAEVVAAVLMDPGRFSEVFNGMMSTDPVVRMRSADAVEKISRTRPELLQPFKGKLIRRVAGVDQQEVQWHVAQMLPRLNLSRAERSQCLGILKCYLLVRSSLVRTFALQGLADLAEQAPGLRKEVLEMLETAVAEGPPAMKARGRKLIIRLQSLKS